MIETLFCANQEFDEQAMAKILAKQYQQAQHEGALGRLDEIIIRLASHQATEAPEISTPWISVFAADHGIACEEVSEFSQENSVQWAQALCDGTAVTNSLANFNRALLEVIDVGLKAQLTNSDKLQQNKIANATANFAKQAAMSQQQLLDAIQVGIAAAERAKNAGADLFIAGELGVANTTSAIAMTAVLSGKSPNDLMGLGRIRITRQEQHNVALIDNAIALHKENLTSPLRILQYLGGFETAALCGAYIRCAQLGLTVVVDGLMATVAAWIADLVSRNDQLLHCKSVDALMDLGKYSIPETLFCICGNCPRLVEWCFFAHQSAENIHKLILETLAVDPMLHFEMKLGQASGGVLVIPLLQQACAVNKHLPMAQLERTDEVEQNCPFF